MDLFINDASYYSQQIIDIDRCVKLGKLTSGHAKSVGILELPISIDIAPANLAVEALKKINFELADMESVTMLHATVRNQGHDFWPAWAYISQFIPSNKVDSIGISQMSSGGLAGIQLGCAKILANQSESALVVTSDCFGGDLFDRFHSDDGTFYGDAGTALLISKNQIGFRIIDNESNSDPRLEGLYRGNDDLLINEKDTKDPIDLKSQIRDFLNFYSIFEIDEFMNDCISNAIFPLLDRNKLKIEDISLFVVPNLGKKRINRMVCKPLKLPFHKTTWESGRRVGHLGAGDHAFHLSELFSLKREFKYLLLIGLGAGYSVNSILLEDCR